MKARMLFLVPLFFAFGCVSAAAQGVTGSFFVSGGANGVATVPYSADTISIMDRTLADGTHIHRETHGKIYRDSQGRTRRETEMLVPAGQEPFTMIHISDPVQRLSISVNTRDHTANVTHFPDPQKIATERPTVPANGTGATLRAETKRDDLGTQDVEGILAHGTRMTRTIPAGSEGNDQPILIVTETWMAQDLGMSVLTKNTDPRNGTSETRLTNIQRAEPDPALFQVPADYKIKDNGQPQ